MRGEDVDMQGNPKQYSGEFVLTSNGNIDFGEISPEIASLIKRQAGKIRLRIGKQDESSKENYGEAHIERTARLKDLQAAGFNNARDFVEYVCFDYDAIYPNRSGLIVFRRGPRFNTAYVQLVPSIDGDFYDVKTVVSSSRNVVKNKTPLWKKAQ